MAKVDPQAALVRGPNGRVTETVTWGPMSPGDEIGWYDHAKSESGPFDSVQVEGEFSGSKCRIEGSNNGRTGRLLTNAMGMEAVVDVAGLHGLGVATRLVRPVLDGGDKSTKITVTAYGRGA